MLGGEGSGVLYYGDAGVYKLPRVTYNRASEDKAALRDGEYGGAA